jgi:predicted RNase H-like HicB family nuclease
MIDLPYPLIIEATEEPDYFGFYSPDLEGFTGIGHSVEDCIYKARWGMQEHIALLREQGLPVPTINYDPKIVIENEKKLAVARDFPPCPWLAKRCSARPGGCPACVLT